MSGLNGSVRPLTGAVGAEILDIDLGGQPAFDEIGRTLDARGVIFFRDQKLSPEQEIAFARRFGTITPTVNLKKVAGYPLIDEVRKEPGENRALGDTWHADQTFQKKPPRYTILFGHEIPPSGGDTLFISTAAAYEALSPGLRQTLDGLRAVHLDSGPYGLNRAEGRTDVAEASHPVVVRMPGTERKALYVNPDKTARFDGWTAEESAGLLDYLYRHMQRPEFGCRFRWREGSIAIWDNFQTWHYAVNDYPGQRRVMHRIMVSAAHFE